MQANRPKGQYFVHTSLLSYNYTLLCCLPHSMHILHVMSYLLLDTRMAIPLLIVTDLEDCMCYNGKSKHWMM